MNKFLSYFSGSKTYTAIAILSTAALVCPILGVPAAVTGGIVAAGSLLGIIGRLHAGSKLEDEQAKVTELTAQVEVLRQYAQGKR
jgi:hypothetical protein